MLSENIKKYKKICSGKIMYESRIIRKQEACMFIISITFDQAMFYCIACIIEIEYHFFKWIEFFPSKLTYWWDMHVYTYMQNDG